MARKERKIKRFFRGMGEKLYLPEHYGLGGSRLLVCRKSQNAVQSAGDVYNSPDALSAAGDLPI
jgi:hypothetical protein